MQTKICGEINNEMKNKMSEHTFIYFFTTLYINFDIKIEKRKRFFNDIDFKIKFNDIDCFFDIANEVINSEFDFDFVLYLFFVLFKRYFNV